MSTRTSDCRRHDVAVLVVLSSPSSVIVVIVVAVVVIVVLVVARARCENARSWTLQVCGAREAQRDKYVEAWPVDRGRHSFSSDVKRSTCGRSTRTCSAFAPPLPQPTTVVVVVVAAMRSITMRPHPSSLLAFFRLAIS